MQRHAAKSSRQIVGRGITSCRSASLSLVRTGPVSKANLTNTGAFFVSSSGKQHNNVQISRRAYTTEDLVPQCAVSESNSSVQSISRPDSACSSKLPNYSRLRAAAISRQSTRQLHSSTRRYSLEPHKPSNQHNPPHGFSRDEPVEEVQRKPVSSPLDSIANRPAIQKSTETSPAKKPTPTTPTTTTPTKVASEPAKEQPKHTKKLPQVRKEIRLDDYLTKKDPPLVRIRKTVGSLANTSAKIGVRLGQWTLNIPINLIWALGHPVQAWQITAAKTTSGWVWTRDAFNHHVRQPWRLLKVDFKLMRAIFKKRKQEGRSEFTAVERRKLQSIGADFLKIVPYSVFFAVPFMELLLPFYIKLFPAASPSWFETRDTREQRLRTKIEFQRSMADFLVGTITQYETKMERKSELSLGRFKTLMNQLQKTNQDRRQLDITQLHEYVPLFNVHLNLNRLDSEFLTGMAKLLGISTPPGIAGQPIWLSYNIRRRMKALREEDARLYEIGISELEDQDVIAQNVMRGGRGVGMTRSKLERQLDEWIQMNYVHNFPESLTLVVRAHTASASLVVKEPKELRDKQLETVEKAEKVKESMKEQAEQSKSLERKLINRKYSLNMMMLKEIKLSLNDLLAIYHATEELCDIVNARDAGHHVSNIQYDMSTKTTPSDKLAPVKARVEKLTKKMDQVIHDELASKSGLTSEELDAGEPVETLNGHLSENLVVQYYTNNYSSELEDGSVFLSEKHEEYIDTSKNEIHPAIISHLVSALNPECDPAGVNVKLARQAIQVELDRITEQDEELKAMKLKFKDNKKTDYTQKAFTESRHDLFNIGKMIVKKKQDQLSLKKNAMATTTPPTDSTK